MEEKANLTEGLDENLSDLGTEEKFLKSYMLCGANYSEDKVQAVRKAKLKSVTLTVVLSAFLGLFGAGSFYLGYWKRGICKIVFNVLVPLALGMVFLFWLAPLQDDTMRSFIEILFTVMLSIDGAIIIAYWIGEVFKDRAKCLNDNCNKIKNLLQ